MRYSDESYKGMSLDELSRDDLVRLIYRFARLVKERDFIEVVEIKQVTYWTRLSDGTGEEYGRR
ncbi:hypothetical protein [Dyella marensis]|uniref:hypothetical protein n=1 Tax=Dyella marensis TaxID=500610 RepID=UPI0031D5C074